MEKWQITLSDGTVLSNLRLNGNNFISDSEVTADTFAGKLGRVTIVDPQGNTDIRTNMELVQVTTYDSEEGFHFILREIPEDEMNALKLRSDVDYIAAMADIDLEEV